MGAFAIERILDIDQVEYIASLCGEMDNHLRIVEKALGVTVVNRAGQLKINGGSDACEKAVKVFQALLRLLEKGQPMGAQTVDYCISAINEGSEEELVELADSSTIFISQRGKPIRPKTTGQKRYVEAIRRQIVTMGIGPAGTGKTYLAVAMAVAAFTKGEVSRIVLTRPAVEAGEKLGFLPGDLQQKIDPYLRPLHDALFDMLGPEAVAKHMERGSLEIAPLAYMRGRTLDDSFIILDEAQNTTREQMKMFLTRLGFNSKAVITGDVTQIDLAEPRKSGLLQAMRVLRDVEGIDQVRFSETDVVRHRIVKDIIKAYARYEDGKEKL